MPNTLLTISDITVEALRILENNLRFTKFVRRDFDSKYGVEGAKIGDTLNVRKPVRYVNTTGQGLQLQDATETSVPLTLATQYQRAFAFTSKDLALSIDEFGNRFVKPALASMANQIDFDGLKLYQTVAGVVGTPGVVPNALSTYLAARVKLANNAAPMDDELSFVLDPNMEASIVDVLKGLFQSSTDIARQYKEGTMGSTIGFKWSMDQNVWNHTIGTYTGVPLVNGATVSGATSLVTDGWTAAADNLNQGDVFTIAGVNLVNPQSRQSTGQLAQFVVTAGQTSSGGNMTIPFSPAMVSSGPFQNIDALPANNAPLTIFGATATATHQGLAFHKDAFAFACADLPLPNGVDMAGRKSDDQLGMSIRLIRAYDINTDRFPLRCDLLGGWGTLYQELACRIASS